MLTSKIIGQSRPHLAIEIEAFERKISDFKETDTTNNVMLKPLRSAKNGHELRQFNFDDNAIEVVNTERKLRKLRQLEREKDDLMHSLQILKESAVSAIAEKEDEIQRLRLKDCLTNDEKLEFYEAELERSKRVRMELEDERQQLSQQFQEERIKLIDDLEEKQYMIEALHQEIQSFRRELEAYEQNDHVKNKKIKILTEENHRLALEISQKSSYYQSKEEAEPANLDVTIRKGSISSVSSSHPHSMVGSTDNFSAEMDKTFLSERLDELGKIHKQQLNDLKTLYQKRMQDIRQIYEKELELPEENVSVRSNTYSRRSSRQEDKKLQSDHNLYLNLKDMYSIQEQTEELLETSRANMNDLKYQIKMQNLSECPSAAGNHLRRDQDGQSQFTTKYFQNPFVFMKKNRSKESLAVEEHEIKTTLKLKRENQRFENIETEPQEQPCVEEEKRDPWKQHKIFGFGLLSGAALASLVGFFINKNK